MIRIRYDYNDTGVIGISRQRYKINGVEIRVVIHENDFYFEFVDNQGNPVFKGGNTRNVAVLRKQAKTALVKMGAKFDQETRDRNNTSQSNGS